MPIPVRSGQRARPHPTLDVGAFRDAIGHFATGVTVVTTSTDHGDFGMTASAVSSLSLDPAMLLLCVNDLAPTRAAIGEAGRFALHVLRDDQVDLARRFATPALDKFEGLHLSRDSEGIINIPSVFARFACRVIDGFPGGTHTIFAARVESATVSPGRPLVYLRGEFGGFRGADRPVRFELERDHVGW